MQIIDSMRAEIEKSEASGRRRPIEKFVLAALSRIPWIGSFVTAAASLKSEEEGATELPPNALWVEEHQRKLIELARLLEEVRNRFESLASDIDERIQSESYLSLVRKAFRTWDEADTEQKRRMRFFELDEELVFFGSCSFLNESQANEASNVDALFLIEHSGITVFGSSSLIPRHQTANE